MTAPVVGVSILLLGVGGVAAWYVQRLQRNASDVLAINVGSMRAAEELEIGLREIRTQMNQFLMAGKQEALDTVPTLRANTDHWLAEADRLATTSYEQELMTKVKRGYDRFFREFEGIAHGGANGATMEEVASLVNEVLTKEIVAPAHEYLDFNEQVMARNSAHNQVVVNRMVFALLLLGICGPVAGLLTGFAIARGVSRSIVQLSVPVHDAAGKLNEVVGPITLSGNRGIEELDAGLRRMATEIDTVVSRLQQSQREVLRAEQLAAVGQLAAGVAHELRNPLMSMKLLVQTASESGESACLEGRDLQVLGDAIGRLERSVTTFLDFARPPALEKRSVELRSIVEDTVRLLSARAISQGVHVECSAPQTPILLTADPGQLRQVLLNLLINGLDAMPRGGKLQIVLSEQEQWGEECQDPISNGDTNCSKWILIRVLDTGCGLAANIADRIFDPFVTSKETGTGLGLPICRRIIEAHMGEITAGNRSGSGAEFTVRLPQTRDAVG
jgi:signal transduction histidine kinase